MNPFYICPICDRKLSSNNFSTEHILNKRFGICNECIADLPYTDTDGCFEGREYLSYVISPLYYVDKVRDIFIKYKFSHNKIYSNVLSVIVNNVLYKHEYIKDFDLLVPIPISKKRFAERGYNQSGLIAAEIAEKFDIAYSENILVKSRDTLKQSRLRGMDRINNIRDSFYTESNLTGFRVLLFDDIFTTGNTMNEAARVLKSAGASTVVGISAAIVRNYKYDFEYAESL